MDQPIFEMRVGFLANYGSTRQIFGLLRKGEYHISYPLAKVIFFTDYLLLVGPKNISDAWPSEFKLMYSDIESFRWEWRFWGVQISHHNQKLPRYIILRRMGWGKKLQKKLQEKFAFHHLPF